MQQTEGLLF